MPATPQAEKQLNLPHVAYNNFYHAFTSSGKRAVVLLYAALVVAVVGMVYFAFFPAGWVVELHEVPQGGAALATVRQVQAGYRTLPCLAEAYYAFTFYSAGPIAVSAVLVWALAGFAVLGWAALLAAATRMDGVWGYALYFVFGCWVYMAEGARLFFGTDPWRLLSLALGLACLAPALLFKNRIVSWSLASQVAVNAATLTTYLLMGYVLHGFAGLHQLVTYPLAAAGIVVIFFVFFTSRELMNLILLVATNHEQVNRRQPFWRILTLMLVVVLSLWVLAAQAYGYLKSDGWLAYASVLLAITALCAVFTLQNMYHQLREWLTVPLAFALFILGAGVLACGTLLYAFGSGEYNVMSQTLRFTLLVYALISTLYLLYLLVYFTPYLRKRVNIFYVFLEPPRPTPLRFLAAWFITLVVVALVEGSSRFRTPMCWLTGANNQRADNAQLMGNAAEAKRSYAATLTSAAGDVKANYNLAALTLAEEGPLAAAGTQVTTWYDNAETARAFAYARLNHGNTLMARNLRREAIAAYQRHISRWPDARVLNNLAGHFRAGGEPDSAIHYLKQALLLAPSDGALYANLALIYSENGKNEEARKFLQAAVEVQPARAAVLQNAAYWNMTAGLQNPIPLSGSAPSLADTTLPTATRYSLALAELHAGRIAQADAAANSLLRAGEPPEALMLKLLTLAQTDSIDNLLSRYAFLYETVPYYRALAAHTLGVYYAQHGVPEAAQVYFTQSAQNGKQLKLGADSLLAAYTLADAGGYDAAYTLLGKYRAYHPEAYKPATREIAILLRAFNKPELAEWDLADATPEEILRLGIYAHQAGHLEITSQVYQQLVQKDSLTTVPYLEIGRMFRDQADSLALIQFDAGLPRNPKDVLLLTEKARSLLRMGRSTQVQAIMNELSASHGTHPEVQLLQAEAALAARTPAPAQTLLEVLHAERPLDTRITLQLAAVYVQTNNPVAALKLLDRAVTLNPQNYRLWLRYAAAALAMNQDADARIGADNALKTTYTETQRKQVQAELKQLGL